MILLDGRELSKKLRANLQAEVAGLYSVHKLRPKLCVVMCGDYAPSRVYVKNKINACNEVGIESTQVSLPGDISKEDLVRQVQELSQKNDIDGILVQFPLPQNLPSSLVLEHLSYLKDVDGFTYPALGRLMAGQDWVRACTPWGIIRLLEHYKIPIAGKKAVVLGRSLIVGQPMSVLLTQKDATVTLCHSKTPDVKKITQEADIVVVATHQRQKYGREYFKKGAVVVDVGIHPPTSPEAKLCGDVKFDELEGWVSAATPVPGGVGPMTIYSLLENTVTLFKKVRLGL